MVHKMSGISLKQSKDQCLKEKTKLKKCNFPGCEIHFQGRGIEKYCQEHRQKKYYKELYFNKYKERDKESLKDIKKNNQIIKHKSCAVFEINSICALKGCYERFTVTVTPGNSIYPKFCEKHRNEFKREMWLKGIRK